MYEQRLFDIDDYGLSESDTNHVNKIILNILLDISALLEKAEEKIQYFQDQKIDTDDIELKILSVKASTYDAIDDLILNII